jgi:glycine oxidase
MTDAIVIGGGVIGLSIAWRLQQQGRNTLLIERGRLGHSATWAAAGMLTPVSEATWTETELLALGLESLRRYPDFVAEVEEVSGHRVDFDRGGTLMVALDADEARYFQRLLEFQQRLGLGAEWLDTEATLEREPLLSPRVVGSITAPGDYQLDNRKLTEALALCFERAGGRVFEETPVEAIRLDGERVRGVVAAGDTLSSELVVLAAGAWSAQLRGLPEPLLPPVRPVRGQIVHLAMDPTMPLTRHVIRGRRAYCVPRPDGRLLVGATSEERGFDESLTAGGVYELLRGVYELLPGAYEVRLADLCVGLRPGSRDNLPILGPSPIVGLHYATGHYRSGILLTPITAWAISEAIETGTVPEALKPFSIRRFLE